MHLASICQLPNGVLCIDNGTATWIQLARTLKINFVDELAKTVHATLFFRIVSTA